MFSIIQKESMRIIPFVLALAALAAGAGITGYKLIYDLQRSHSEFVGTEFSAYLTANVTGIAGIIDGSVPPRQASQAIGDLNLSGAVYGFRLYDDLGYLRADYALMRRGYHFAREFAPRDDDAGAVLATRQPVFELDEGDTAGEPAYYSRNLMPLMDGKTMIGVLEYYSDESESWPMLVSRFRSVILEVVLVLALTGLVPLIFYLRRSGQLDLTARRLDRFTEYDDLTGALNRAPFVNTVDELLSSACEKRLAVAIHIIDLDHFMMVNETRGHAAGDEILKISVQRLRSVTGTRERLARIGGDEFAICQPYPSDMPDMPAELAHDIVQVMKDPFETAAGRVQIGASVGYACHPRHGAGSGDLFRAAEIALHGARSRGYGRAAAFTPKMETERQRRLSIEFRLREALARDEFTLDYQPVVDAATGQLRGFEALLRLNGADGKPVGPDEFIPIAEDIGLISEIGAWVLAEACQAATGFPDELTVSVNLSPAQFANGDIPKLVGRTLELTGLAPERLELEVTESLLIGDTDAVLAQLRGIKALGVSVALDDFGTGYSSLSYLWQFPFDKLKVDKSFMRELDNEQSKSREILSTIIALGKVLNLQITAEGVETEGQSAILRDLNCDLIQGYLYGKPMPQSEMAATLVNSLARGTNRAGRKTRAVPKSNAA